MRCALLVLQIDTTMHHSLQEVTRNLRTIKHYVKISRTGLPAVTKQLRKYVNFHPTQATQCQCMKHVDLGSLIRAAVDEIEKEPLRQLCLRCVKGGFVSVAEGNCSAITEEQCTRLQGHGVRGTGDSVIDPVML